LQLRNAVLKVWTEFLSHNTALAISKDDVVAPAKVAVEFAKKNEALKIKAGLLRQQADVTKAED
jgi:large subunit ribosomal protein L10